jgi:hypothetical protein
MARRLISKQRSAIYAQHKCFFHLVYALIKEVRDMMRFLLLARENDGLLHLITGMRDLLYM